MTYVVTAASGQLGRGVVEHLLRRGVAPGEVLATARRREALDDLAARGVRTARLDYDDVERGVLAAGDTVLLVSGSEVGQRERQHGAVVEAAVAAGVARLLYTSAPAATDTPLVLAPEHAATERIIAASGLPATVLRNGWYTENYRQAFDQAGATGEVVTSTGHEARVASAARDDYAEAAAAAMLEPATTGRVLELSGDDAWTFEELAATFAKVLGRSVVHRAVGPGEHQELLQQAGLDEGTAGFVVALDQNTAAGLLAVRTGELSTLIGRPTTPMPQTVAGWDQPRG